MTPEERKIQNEEDFSAIRKTLAGDGDAFAFLQNKYKVRISALIRRMIQNPDDVEDLAQETFIKAYKALPRFQFSYTFSAWIYRIASNNTIDFLRKKRFQMVSIDQPFGEDGDQYIDIKDESLTPEIELISLERKQILEKAISDLPENYRVIVRLRHAEELEYSEISDKLKIPLGTVKAHLFRARKLLYEALKDQKEIIRQLG
jgi:RNA polymerase sigma-70 factor, ECF subfamily